MYTNFTKLPLMGAALFVAGTLFLSSCGGDDDPAGNLTVSTIKSGTTDLNGATPASAVSVSENIVVTFNKGVDGSTATAANVMLMPTGGSAAATTVTASGSTVTIDPTANLDPGTNYTMTLGAGLKGSDGGAFTAKTVTFKTAGRAPVNIRSANMKAFWGFNGNYADSVGSLDGIATSTTWGADRYGDGNRAVMFNGTTSIVEVANALGVFAPSQTVSFWMKLDSTQTHGHFPMGANFFWGWEFEFNSNASFFKHGGGFNKGNGTIDDSLTYPDMETNGDGTTPAGDPHKIFEASMNLKNTLAMKWAHIVYMYDASTKLRTIYINGQKAVQQDFKAATNDLKRVTGQKARASNSTPGELSSTFAFGFAKGRDASFWEDTDFGAYSKPGANHFKGGLDDVRVWDVALTEAEVTSLYNAEKP